MKSDKKLKKILKKVLKKGTTDVNPRAKYEDGVPAHSIFITQVSEKWKVHKGEFPLSTIRPTAWKSSIQEILAIYQTQSNTHAGFQKHGINWWKSWYNEDGNLGEAYAPNLTSSFLENDVVELKNGELSNFIPSRHYQALVDYCNPNFFGYLDSTNAPLPPRLPVVVLSDNDFLKAYGLQSFYNFTREEVMYFYQVFSKMLYYKKIARHSLWVNGFEFFIRTIRYSGNYFRAKVDGFDNYELVSYYYDSNASELDEFNAVWLPKTLLLNHPLFQVMIPASEKNIIKRPRLSRNQVIEVLRAMELDPYSRRIMTSFFNHNKTPRKTLQECAYETLYSCYDIQKKEDDSGIIEIQKCFDMTLNQRSSDYAVAGYVNQIQYIALGMMIGHTVGRTLRKFQRNTQNLHIYDRHIKNVEEMLKRTPSQLEPKLILEADGLDFFEITIDNFSVVDYEKNLHPQLKFDLGI